MTKGSTVGARFFGARPDQSSVMTSTAPSGAPSGRNMPYQVGVASILKPQVKTYEPRARPGAPITPLS